jgi:hypothetical protein
MKGQATMMPDNSPSSPDNSPSSPDNSPLSPERQPTSPAGSPTAAVEPISPAEARQRLEAALDPYLQDGWVIRAQHDYMAQLTRGRRNLEFYVDLVGGVTVTEKGLTPGQASGHLIAWVLLLVSFLLVLAIASALGWFH